MGKIKSIVVVAMVAALLGGTGCKKRKHHHGDDAGTEVADAGAVVDAGAASAHDAGPSAAKDAGTLADGGVKAALGTFVVLSGAAERDAAGAWKVGIQLAPAPPGALPSGAASTSQLSAVITRAAGPAITIALRTSFEMQGITAYGPLDDGTRGNIVPTPIEIPSDATKLAIVADDGKELTALTRKPKLLEITDLAGKPAHGSLDVTFRFEPKSPVSWVLYADKGKADWTQIGAGDDSKPSATIAADALPDGAEVALRLDATDGFNVATKTASAHRPTHEDVAPDAGTTSPPEDGGT